ncbi:hypothetical protein [Microtetraspora sp. NBRC 16547]|uniref:hypothetical protein n=1 Tax=Microtetraspora sp. NBRC 16547 TaxID=3030993 RepID=UPI0025548B47|nr:hypothetical protein [Microtetraspora sp. NBRC 16547]
MRVPMPHARVERRHLLSAAALGRAPQAPRPAEDDDGTAIDAVSGQILDATTHLLIIENDDGQEERLVIAPWATAWRAGPVPPTRLPIGSRVIIRTRAGRVADCVWADMTRMTGIILDVRGRRDLTVEIDSGPHRGRRSVVIPYRSTGRIRVRHPKLEPGYLFDAIGTMQDGAALAQVPATSQPPHRGRAVPPPPPAFGGTQAKISGTAVWSDYADHGAAYPMLESSDTGCDEGVVSCARLPYLSLGSMLFVRNVCAQRSGTVPIVGCGCMAGRFCDRCVDCDTSPRGRIVELSAVSYVRLGGDLTKGCFNAQVGLG